MVLISVFILNDLHWRPPQVHAYNLSIKNVCGKPFRGGFGGLVVSMLASGTRVRGFEPGRIILSMPSFGGEVKESVPCASFVLSEIPVLLAKFLHSSFILL